MISFKLIPGEGCEIYRDGKLVEVVPVVGHTTRLAELGYKTPKPERMTRLNGYGWSQSGRRAA